MRQFFFLCALMGILLLLTLLITESASKPAILATAEYALDTDAAIADRAAERAHAEEMARIAAQEFAVRMEYRTIIVLGVGGIIAVGVLFGALVYGAANRPRITVVKHYIEDSTGGVRVVDGERRLITGKVQEW